MRRHNSLFLVTICIFGLWSLFHIVNSCNEAVCASVVSKCMLLQACKCDMRNPNCTCCKDCFNCLGHLYAECCSCVEMCPKPNVTTNELSKKSHVHKFSESIPGLFEALTEDFEQDTWTSISFPIDLNVGQFQTHTKVQPGIQTIMTSSKEQLAEMQKHVVTLNCTVAYMTQCMSASKCEKSCSSMGAQSYRWFHDGCCECVGENCINYGIDESRCINCPLNEDLEDDTFEGDTNSLEYDDDYDFENINDSEKEKEAEKSKKEKEAFKS